MSGAGDRTRTGTGLESPRDFKLSPDQETIGDDREIAAQNQAILDLEE
jgi:hypothetical protein